MELVTLLDEKHTEQLIQLVLIFQIHDSILLYRRELHIGFKRSSHKVLAGLSEDSTRILDGR